MANVTVWRHETRRCGRLALALPPLAALAVAGYGLVARDAAAELGPATVLGSVFPVVAGLAAVAALGQDRLVELHLTLPTDYRTTVARRLGLLSGVVLVAGAAAALVLVAAGRWNHLAPAATAPVVPFGPAVALMAIGAWAVVALASTAAASATVVAGWLFVVFVWNQYVTGWAANRLGLLVLGLLVTGAALARLRDGERLLGHGEPA